ncbi:extracellular solute-binding protein [Sodalis sp. dw_96]|uniref:ABC transporter substrate-binding protein n=1 Tax=Sodalis sp. dw_96 TaxID=2719794 RepID=UPI001BD651A1|nr:extracellular solute-binding protein [Sodalis sp. dw_96]
MKKVFRYSLLWASMALAAMANAGTLNVNIAFKGANQRAVWESVIKDFQWANPDVTVKTAFIEEETYKVQLPAWLTTVAPDIIKWHEGERMAYYASRGLLEDISGDWTANGWDKQFTSLKTASSYNGKQYAVPTDYYSWGVFYRKDLFAKAGIKAEPTTWVEFLDACQKLKAAGITPILVGGRDSWTLAGWFDYLDFRLNGYDFHMKVMKGEIPYTDPRIKRVYTEWKKLIDNHYFIDNALSYSLDSTLPLFNQGQVAMTLMGTFFSAGIPPEIKQNTGYFRFPIMDKSIPVAEDGSAECLNIPAKAKNKKDARRFLAFVSTPTVNAQLAKAFGSLPANNMAKVPLDSIAQKGFDILSSTTGGIAQFYDRDMTKEMADEGMKGMQRFYTDPGKMDEILAQLEKARQRIYKVQ